MIVKHRAYLSDGSIVCVKEQLGFSGMNRFECRITCEESAGAVSLTGYCSYEDARATFAYAVLIDDAEDLLAELLSDQ